MAIGIGFKTNKNIGNIWLVGFFLSSAIVIWVKMSYSTGMIIDHPHWFKVNYPIGLLRPVLIYLYIHYLLQGFQKIRLLDFLHFIPFTLIVTYLLPLFLLSAQQKLDILNHQVTDPPGLIPAWYIYFQFTYSIIYILAIYRDLHLYIRHHPRPKKSQRQVIRWIKFLLWGGLCFIGTTLILRIFGLTGHFNYYVYEIFSILLILLCVKLLSMPDVIHRQTHVTTNNLQPRFTKLEVDTFYSSLTSLMQDEQLFKQVDLKVKHLAIKLNLPDYLVSQIINQKAGLSFRHFINAYRVREARKLLIRARDQYSIEGIAREVGFSSRASFYTAFKKETNQTPTEYLKNSA